MYKANGNSNRKNKILYPCVAGEKVHTYGERHDARNGKAEFA